MSDGTPTYAEALPSRSSSACTRAGRTRRARRVCARVFEGASRTRRDSRAPATPLRRRGRLARSRVARLARPRRGRPERRGRVALGGRVAFGGRGRAVRLLRAAKAHRLLSLVVASKPPRGSRAGKPLATSAASAAATLRAADECHPAFSAAELLFALIGRDDEEDEGEEPPRESDAGGPGPVARRFPPRPAGRPAGTEAVPTLPPPLDPTAAEHAVAQAASCLAAVHDAAGSSHDEAYLRDLCRDAANAVVSAVAAPKRRDASARRLARVAAERFADAGSDPPLSALVAACARAVAGAVAKIPEGVTIDGGCRPGRERARAPDAETVAETVERLGFVFAVAERALRRLHARASSRGRVDGADRIRGAPERIRTEPNRTSNVARELREALERVERASARRAARPRGEGGAACASRARRLEAALRLTMEARGGEAGDGEGM